MLLPNSTSVNQSQFDGVNETTALIAVVFSHLGTQTNTESVDYLWLFRFHKIN